MDKYKGKLSIYIIFVFRILDVFLPQRECGGELLEIFDSGLLEVFVAIFFIFGKGFVFPWYNICFHFLIGSFQMLFSNSDWWWVYCG